MKKNKAPKKYNFLMELDFNIDNSWGEYTLEQKNKIIEWVKRLGIEEKNIPLCFKDAEFLRVFLNKIPEEEQYYYFENTYRYFIEIPEYAQYEYVADTSKKPNLNPKYIIFTRRAVPSEKPKPEPFWTSNHRIALCGLQAEIPEGTAQRYHSAIMVTTLDRLIQHGINEKGEPGSDGEIAINPKKNFTNFLFMYKPEVERVDLEKYLRSGGESREEVLKKLKEAVEKRENPGEEIEVGWIEL